MLFRTMSSGQDRFHPPQRGGAPIQVQGTAHPEIITTVLGSDPQSHCGNNEMTAALWQVWQTIQKPAYADHPMVNASATTTRILPLCHSQ